MIITILILAGIISLEGILNLILNDFKQTGHYIYADTIVIICLYNMYLPLGVLSIILYCIKFIIFSIKINKH